MDICHNFCGQQSPHVAFVRGTSGQPPVDTCCFRHYDPMNVGVTKDPLKGADAKQAMAMLMQVVEQVKIAENRIIRPPTCT